MRCRNRCRVIFPTRLCIERVFANQCSVERGDRGQERAREEEEIARQRSRIAARTAQRRRRPSQIGVRSETRSSNYTRHAVFVEDHLLKSVVVLGTRARSRSEQAR